MALLSPQNLFERALRGGRVVTGSVPTPVAPLTAYHDWPRLYQMLLDYYENTGLYDQITAALAGQRTWSPAMKGIRNPAFRIAEFYVDHTWPGELENALPIEDASRDLATAITQFWTWSNLRTRKQQLVRMFSIFGDAFWKVAQPAGGQRRIYLEYLDPRLVTELDVDERNFVTRIRLDDDKTRQLAGPMVEYYTRTEIWSKDTQSVRIWEHPGRQYDVESEPPLDEHYFEDWGINFVPIVWMPFLDVGEGRGVSRLLLLKDKIDEVNRAATRLHQILFRYNRAIMATTGSSGAIRQPLPPVRVNGREVGRSDATYLGDDDLYQLPAGSDIKLLVPQIAYGEALNIVNAQLMEIERDAPELLYYRLTEMGDTSGRSIRYFMGPATKKVIEVRANAEAGLVRLNQMALTIGQYMGLFSGLGSYEQGDFEHRFAPREVIPISEIDQAQIDQDRGQASTYLLSIGVKPQAIVSKLWKDRGFVAGDVEEPKPVTNPTMPTNTPQNAPPAGASTSA